MAEENSNIQRGTQKIRILVKNHYIPPQLTTNEQTYSNTENYNSPPSNSETDDGSREKFVDPLISVSLKQSAKHMSETDKLWKSIELNHTNKDDTRAIVKPHKDKMLLSSKSHAKFISSDRNDGLNNAIATKVTRRDNKSLNGKMTPCIPSKLKTGIIKQKNDKPKSQENKKMNLVRKKKSCSSKTANDKSNKISTGYDLRSTVKTKNQVHANAKKSSGRPKKYKQTDEKKSAEASNRKFVMENGHALSAEELRILREKFLRHGHFRVDPNVSPFILLVDNEHNIQNMKMHCYSSKSCCTDDASQTTVISNHIRDKKCVHNTNKSTNHYEENSSENRKNVQHQKSKACNSSVFADLSSDTYDTGTCDASTNTDINNLNKICSISNNMRQWNPIVSTLNNGQRRIERKSNYNEYMHCNDTQQMDRSNNYPSFTNIIGLNSLRNSTPSNTWTENLGYSSYAPHSATKTQSNMNNISSDNETPIVNNSGMQANHSNILLNIPNTTFHSNNASSMNTFQYINPNVYNRHSIFNNLTSNNVAASTTNSNSNVFYNTNHSSQSTNNQNSVINRSNNLGIPGATVLPAWNNLQTQVYPQTYTNDNICYAYTEQQTNAANIPVNNNQSFLENNMHNIRNTNVYVHSPNTNAGTLFANNISNITTQGNGMNSLFIQPDSSASVGSLPNIHTILSRSYLTDESSVNFRQNVEMNEAKDVNNIQGGSCIDNNYIQQNTHSNTNAMDTLESYLPLLSHFKQDKDISESELSIGNQDSSTAKSMGIDFYLQRSTSESSDCLIIDLEKPSTPENTASPNIQQLRQVLADFTKQYPNHEESPYTPNQSETKYKDSPNYLENTTSCITLD